jgi:DNA-binding NarL/FixJ family response regulator
MNARISLILADDHLIVREGIRKLLETNSEFLVIGEARTGREAVELTIKLEPDVVVMDIAMPLLNGLEACRQLSIAGSLARVLILSAHGEDTYVDRAIEAGAAGFLLKQAPGIALALAIREIHAGRPFFSAPILRRLRDTQTSAHTGTRLQQRARLTAREAEVLQLIAEGKANKETAAELGISIKTVEKHRTNLMCKLNIHDTASLTRYAVSAGIIENLVQNTVV